MSDSKNHKLAIQAIIEAHRTPGKMREIMLQVLCDKPSAIVNAWGVVKPKTGTCSKCGRGTHCLHEGLCLDCHPEGWKIFFNVK